jgi:hypothetical protein
MIALAGVVAFVCSLLAHALALLVLVPMARAYARRRFARERKAFAAHDAKTWRVVHPMLLGAAHGSVSHIAGVVNAEAPVGLTYTFRARDTAALPRGTVRVSFEAGTKEES